MNLNPNIILQAQQPDVVGTLHRANVAAAGANQMRDDNALRSLMQQQGPQIMAGDPNALNALSRLDPQQALQIQSNQQVMQQRRQEAQMNAHKYASQLSAEQAAAEAKELEAAITQGIQFYQRGDLNGLNAHLVQIGEQPIQSLDDFPAVAAMHGDALDVLKQVKDMSAKPEPADEYQRYVAEEKAAGRQPLSRIDYAQAKKGKGVTVFDPATGQPIVQMGGGANEPPTMTVDAGKNTGFLIRMNDSNEILNELENQGTDFIQQNLDRVWFGAGNYARTDEFQRYDQARRDFVNAILRRESGAVIADSEFENANKQYFPVPGDSPEVIKQKRKNRENAIAGVRAGAGPGGAYADNLRGPAAGDNRNPDFSAMTDEELDAWIAENGE